MPYDNMVVFKNNYAEWVKRDKKENIFYDFIYRKHKLIFSDQEIGGCLEKG